MAYTPWNSRTVLGFPPTGGQSGQKMAFYDGLGKYDPPPNQGSTLDWGNVTNNQGYDQTNTGGSMAGSGNTRVPPGNGRGPLLNEPFTKTPFQATMNGQPYDNSNLRGGFGGDRPSGFGGNYGGFGDGQMPYHELMRALMARRRGGPRQSDPLPPVDRPMGARRY